jgi:LemA protein
MSISIHPLLGVVFFIIFLVYIIITYNNLVQVKNNVSKAWANIDVLMKQRHDELPKLISTCNQYMEFEQTTLREITEARSQIRSATQAADIRLLGMAESTLKNALGNLFAIAENYPELKSNSTFLNLQQRISTLEESIADRREFYNESVNINNTRIAQIPELILARLFGFHPFELFHVVASDKRDIDVSKLFNVSRNTP